MSPIRKTETNLNDECHNEKDFFVKALEIVLESIEVIVNHVFMRMTKSEEKNRRKKKQKS